jgi:hypothetical protein
LASQPLTVWRVFFKFFFDNSLQVPFSKTFAALPISKLITAQFFLPSSRSMKRDHPLRRWSTTWRDRHHRSKLHLPLEDRNKDLPKYFIRYLDDNFHLY